MHDRTEEIWEDEVPRHDLSVPDRGPVLELAGGSIPKRPLWEEIDVDRPVYAAGSLNEASPPLIHVVVTIGRMPDA